MPKGTRRAAPAVPKRYHVAFDDPPPVLHLEEREGRLGKNVQVRWWRADKKRWDKMSLGYRVRAANGKLLPSQVRRAERDGYRYHRGLAEGVIPPRLDARTAPQDADLTIVAGLAEVMDPERGEYPSSPGSHAQEQRRARERHQTLIEDALRTRAGEHGKLTWVGATPIDLVRRIARHIAAVHQYTGRGYRVAEQACDLLFKAAKWLRQHKRIPQDAFLRPEGWRATLRRDWGAVTPLAIDPDKPGPRHNAQEFGRLLAALDPVPCDDLVKDVVALAGSQLEPSIRLCLRSDLDLRPGQGLHGHGTLLVRTRGRGSSRERRLDLTARVRAQFEAALQDGFLTHLEAEREDMLRGHRPKPSPSKRRGPWNEPGDYPLFPHVDPRLRLALRLGAEQRVGQVRRAWRSNLDLDSAPGGGLGKLRIPGRGKKRTQPIVLDPSLRAAIDAELTRGYLCQLEAAYVRGDLKDYPLFPGGPLAGGAVSVPRAGHALQPVTESHLRQVFLRLERLAGVKHVEARGWYGLKRTAIDLADGYTSRTSTKEILSGHVRGSAARARYASIEPPEAMRESMQVRVAMRADLLAGRTNRELQEARAHLSALVMGCGDPAVLAEAAALLKTAQDAPVTAQASDE